ncbi:MAG: sn-glycerol-3-phosphate ABC transporter ATP-binding protein UgpC [Clostridia bacterium]|nr:sn-glycerol-3-phosphate ABC transporter ATP-binding protein UgpC [Clostridia bacterium]
MASLSLKHIYKVYDGGVKAVNDFCMEIDDKEFIVFVGPSGCGKSTTLRMIAGLEEITAGELMIGDEVVNDVEPKDRNIAMVFQNYALYPHMTVRENMAFALRLRKDLSEEEIMARVDEAAAKLDIAQFLDRKPRALSGGQRQRVSLGRAIVRSPKVFLLDEPLSNLDAKLRAQMRTEISKLHKQLATTFIYVTHDQVEAMTMGTRIVVMKFGVVQQIDTPKNLYDFPGNKFVAGFIGTPQMNFFDATLRRDGEEIEITFANDRKIRVPRECLVKAKSKYLDGETVVTLGIRPEDIHFEEEFVQAHPKTALDTSIGIIEALGSESIVYCELDPDRDSISDSGTRMVLKVDPRIQLSIDQPIRVALDPERIHLFDHDTEMSIMPRVPDVNLLQGKVKGGQVDFDGVKFALPEALALADGEYRFAIPSDAFRFDHEEIAEEIAEGDPKHVVPAQPVPPKYAKKAFVGAVNPLAHAQFAHVVPGGEVEVEVKSVETVGKVKLLRFAFGDDPVFAVGNADLEDGIAKIKTDIDWKKVSIVDAEGNEIPALNLTNVLHGKMVKERIGKKDFNFGLDLAGKIFYSTEFVQQKLFNAAGRKVFDINLDVDFDPYSVMIAEEGIPAKVSKISHFNGESFATCSVGDSKVNVFLRQGQAPQEGDEVNLSLDITALGIVEADRGIRII